MDPVITDILDIMYILLRNIMENCVCFASPLLCCVVADAMESIDCHLRFHTFIIPHFKIFGEANLKAKAPAKQFMPQLGGGKKGGPTKIYQNTSFFFVFSFSIQTFLTSF
jgi:hypothetical protein